MCFQRLDQIAFQVLAKAEAATPADAFVYSPNAKPDRAKQKQRGVNQYGGHDGASQRLCLYGVRLVPSRHQRRSKL